MYFFKVDLIKCLANILSMGYLCSWPFEKIMKMLLVEHSILGSKSNVNRWTPPPPYIPRYIHLWSNHVTIRLVMQTHTGTDSDKRYELKFQINIQIIVEFTLLLFFRYKDFTTLYSIIILSALIFLVLGVCMLHVIETDACMWLLLISN